MATSSEHPVPSLDSFKLHDTLIQFTVAPRVAATRWVYPTNVPPRQYQIDITRTALFNNTLVCLPTGLGKTLIAAVVMVNYYEWFPKGKIVFMAPTKPLVDQQREACLYQVSMKQSVIQNLMIETVEFRDEHDPEIEQHTHEKAVETIVVPSQPEMQTCHQLLHSVLEEVVNPLIKNGLTAALESLIAQDYEHPKIQMLMEVLTDHFTQTPNGRVIVFTSLRDTVVDIAETIKRRNDPTIKPRWFIGQGSGTTSGGPKMTQTEQKNVLTEFRNGTFNTLVATCIAEEGLDIPEVQLIVCFDGAASPLRDTQRMGRTGRHAEGRVVYLLNEGKEQRKFNKNSNESGYLKTLLRRSRFQFEMWQDRPKLFPQNFNPEMMMIQMETTHPKDLKETGRKREGRALKSDGPKQMRLDAFAVTHSEKSAKKTETCLQKTVHAIDDLNDPSAMSEKRRRMTSPLPTDLIDLTDTEDDKHQLSEVSPMNAITDIPGAMDSKTHPSLPPETLLPSSRSFSKDTTGLKNRFSDADEQKRNAKDGRLLSASRHGHGAKQMNVTSSRIQSTTRGTEAFTDDDVPEKLPEQPDISLVTHAVFLAKDSVFKKTKPPDSHPLMRPSNSESNN